MRSCTGKTSRQRKRQRKRAPERQPQLHRLQPGPQKSRPPLSMMAMMVMKRTMVVGLKGLGLEMLGVPPFQQYSRKQRVLMIEAQYEARSLSKVVLCPYDFCIKRRRGRVQVVLQWPICVKSLRKKMQPPLCTNFQHHVILCILVCIHKDKRLTLFAIA